MPKPILVIKIKGYLSPERFEVIREQAEKGLKDEYHVLVVPDRDIPTESSFEVHGAVVYSLDDIKSKANADTPEK